MLEWYTTLLTFSQAVAVYLVSIVAITVGLGIWFVKDSDGEFSGPISGAFAVSLLVYPILYWGLFIVVGFIDLIGWLWAQ